ncbi:hypothetical protein D1823_21695 (plasmid) [Ruegeria sp. AD91A]|nr:hypothetical protein D1823_21695 [Ruegeria sp. AD91A]
MFLGLSFMVTKQIIDCQIASGSTAITVIQFYQCPTGFPAKLQPKHSDFACEVIHPVQFQRATGNQIDEPSTQYDFRYVQNSHIETWVKQQNLLQNVRKATKL